MYRLVARFTYQELPDMAPAVAPVTQLHTPWCVSRPTAPRSVNSPSESIRTACQPSRKRPSATPYVTSCAAEYAMAFSAKGLRCNRCRAPEGKVNRTMPDDCPSRLSTWSTRQDVAAARWRAGASHPDATSSPATAAAAATTVRYREPRTGQPSREIAEVNASGCTFTPPA